MTKFSQYQVESWAEAVVAINRVCTKGGHGPEAKRATAELVFESCPFDFTTMVNISVNTSDETHELKDIIQMMELSIEGVPNGFI